MRDSVSRAIAVARCFDIRRIDKDFDRTSKPRWILYENIPMRCRRMLSEKSAKKMSVLTIFSKNPIGGNY